jgi:hypothetical protein
METEVYSVGVLDSISFATSFAQEVAKHAVAQGREDDASARAYAKNVGLYHKLFPWLVRFRILMDGNIRRWKVVDSLNPDDAIVLPSPEAAEVHLRDLVLQVIGTMIVEMPKIPICSSGEGEDDE